MNMEEPNNQSTPKWIEEQQQNSWQNGIQTELIKFPIF